MKRMKLFAGLRPEQFRAGLQRFKLDHPMREMKVGETLTW